MKLTDFGKARAYDEHRNRWAKGLVALLIADSTLVEGKKVYSFPVNYPLEAADARDALCYGLPLQLILARFHDEIGGFRALMKLPVEDRVKIEEKPWENFVYSTRRCDSIILGYQSMEKRLSTLAKLGYDDYLQSDEEPGKILRAFEWTEIERSFRGKPSDEPLVTLIYQIKDRETSLIHRNDTDIYCFDGNPRDALVGIMKFEVTEEGNAGEGK